MRVIGGSMRGRRLEAPKGMTTRPTTDKVKESVFNILQFDLPGARVLDLFAGSGQMGLEALSRGAVSCVFVERDAASARAVEDNIALCGVEKEQARLIRGDSFDFLSLQKRGSFDVILLDPPYGGQLLRRALELINRFDILSRDGIIICEKAPEDMIQPLPEGIAVAKEYRYGKITLCKLTRKETSL